MVAMTDAPLNERPPGPGAHADPADPRVRALARSVDRLGRRLDGALNVKCERCND
jgi:hypothetical protein